MSPEKPLTYLLGQTVNLVKQKLLSKFRENAIEINIEHFSMLHHINENNNLTQQDMANQFMRDKSIILRQVNALIELNYVVRETDVNDKRKKNLMLTKKGKKILADSKKLSREVSNELLDGISEDELKDFENIINKIQINTGYSTSN